MGESVPSGWSKFTWMLTLCCVSWEKQNLIRNRRTSGKRARIVRCTDDRWRMQTDWGKSSLACMGFQHSLYFHHFLANREAIHRDRVITLAGLQLGRRKIGMIWRVGKVLRFQAQRAM